MCYNYCNRSIYVGCLFFAVHEVDNFVVFARRVVNLHYPIEIRSPRVVDVCHHLSGHNLLSGWALRAHGAYDVGQQEDCNSDNRIDK